MAKDFSGQNLRGRSFRGHDLTGANFSGADIRGANFKRACLAGAVFTNVKAGLSRRYQILMSFILLLGGGLAGILSAFSSLFFLIVINGIAKDMFHFDPSYISSLIFFGSIVFCAIFLICMIVAIRKKLFYIVFVLFFIALAVAVGLAVGLIGAGAVAMALALVGAVALSVALAGAVALAMALAVAGPMAVAVAVGLALGSALGLTLAGVLAGTGAWALTLILLSIYIALRSYREDEQFAWLRKWGIFFASLGGTSFKGTDLRGVEFTGADMKGCRFDASTNISRTCFFQAKNLNLARVPGTILENPTVRELLVTGNGEGKSYKGCNLKGACMKGANLTNADLTEADLSGGTLEDASLVNTNLSKVQALDVEFRGVDLTGACLHSWNIDSSTRLVGAHAAYVFLLDNYRERRPSSGEFKEGEFSKLFQEVIHTVDFIFKNGIDWQAFILSFDKLREKIRVENEAGEIAVQSIENKGDGIFVVRVAVPVDMDKGIIHSEFSREYEHQLKRLEERYMSLLEYKEQEIKSREREFSRFRESKEREIAIFREHNINLNEIIRDQAKRPICIQQVTEGIAMQDNRREVHITGDVSGSNTNLGEISGEVSAAIRHLPSSPNPEQPGLKELLTELQALIEKADERQLMQEDKAAALEEVNTLALAGKNPDSGEGKGMVKRSVRFFKGLIAELPTATKLATDLARLVAAISTLFGI